MSQGFLTTNRDDDSLNFVRKKKSRLSTFKEEEKNITSRLKVEAAEDTNSEVTRMKTP